ncbi:hypothetical protein [Ciceribacter sp. L1K22]|uniref:hypothetical protein n=1 Tax=Ciceribacter sp. L1K22 TaxID=2820275 RepID=UPI001FEF52D1|nr:hypothetical protein [Ciceribacter sp. L1K22]
MSTFSTAGDETLVNTDTDRAQYLPKMTALSDGGWVTTWMGWDDSGFGIHQQRYDARGNARGAEQIVNSTTSSFQEDASVAALNDGGWVVTFTHYGTWHEIRQQRYDANGHPVGTETLVSNGSSDQDYSVVAGLADGGWIVTWFGQGGSNGQEVFQQRFDANGGKIGSINIVNSYHAGTQAFPAVTGLADGGWVIAWESFSQDGDSSGVYQQRYNASGQRVGDEIQVNSTTDDNQSAAAVTALADGGWIVTWHSTDPVHGGTDVYFQRYTEAGLEEGGETRVNMSAPACNVTPRWRQQATADGWLCGNPPLMPTMTASTSTNNATMLSDEPSAQKRRSTPFTPMLRNFRW